MDNVLLLNCLESVLGKGKKTASGNYAFHCPFCNHAKPKLEIQLQINKKGENPYHCWVCNEKGKLALTLFRKIEAPKAKQQELRSIVGSSSKTYVEQQDIKVSLPEEFKSLINDTSLEARRAKVYLRKRGLNDEDIIKYNIGYATSGKYADSIIVPSYDGHFNISYFISRKYIDTGARKYDSPRCNKNNIIGFETYINWKTPVILVEGVFDAMAVRRNAVPLFGKSISTALMTKLVESEVKTVYIALDKDAIKDSLGHAKTMLDYGKEVYFIEMDGKDPSELGFEQFTKLIQEANPLTFSDLLLKKIELS